MKNKQELLKEEASLEKQYRDIVRGRMPGEWAEWEHECCHELVMQMDDIRGLMDKAPEAPTENPEAPTEDDYGYDDLIKREKAANAWARCMMMKR